jgi:hypothetical protein
MTIRLARNPKSHRRIATRAELAAVLGATVDQIAEFVASPPSHYGYFRVPKPDGDFREIRPPKKRLRAVQRMLLEQLYKRLRMRQRMSKSEGNPDARPFLDALESAEKALSLSSAYIKDSKAKLSRAKRSLGGKGPVSASVHKLIADLRGLPLMPSCPSMSDLAKKLERELGTLRQRQQDSLGSELKDACRVAGLSFKPLSDGFAVGPFGVHTDSEKEKACLEYAKQIITNDLPLNPQAVVEGATQVKERLLDVPVDIAAFATALEEALRVALARQRKSPKTELRVDLPVAYREMCFVHAARARPGRRPPEYPLPRFVVELKQMIQSDQNLKSGSQFRLETAVLENTKNPRKSIFIPKDLAAGYGEGTYYQAVVLRLP